MWKPSPQTGARLILSSLLTLGSMGCASDSNTAENSPSPSASPSPSPSVMPAAKPKPVRPAKTAASPSPTPTPNSNAYQQAIDAASGAITISKSAVSRDDWTLVASYWQRAINLLKEVPASSTQRAMAVQKLPQYQRFMAEAKQKATPPLKKATQGDVNPQFFSIPIKGRAGGTPIIEVGFNGSRKFEMLFDTGANVTLITREIAESLRLKPEGLTNITVADGATITVNQTTVKSMEVDGRVKRNMSVVVAPPAMPVGLLGQDFYEGYDIAIKESMIEFRKR